MAYKWMAVCILLGAPAALCFAEDPPRPPCNKSMAGKMWPDAANRDHKALIKLAHCGELQMCSRDIWHYRWESLTVRLDQLRGSHFAKPAGCEVLPEPTEPLAQSAANSTK